MTKMVFVKDGDVVTDSLTVAEVFGKRHADVIRSIANLECSEEFNQRNFASVTYIDGKGEERPKYVITRDGFSFLVMGYTGRDAAKFKEDYINEFNRMRAELEGQKLPATITPSQQLQAILMLDGRQQEFEERIGRIENNTTIDYGQQNDLRNLGNRRIVQLLGGKDAVAYANQTLRRQAFAALWNEFKDRFNVNSRNNTRVGEFEKATEYVRNWALPGKIERQVEDENRQVRMF